MPQFHDFDRDAHFDPDASPRYLMVREGKSARVLVANPDLEAGSLNEHVATVEKKHLARDGRVWLIEGKKPPHTYIELFDAKGKRHPERLEVGVKPKMHRTIAFFYVTQDSHRDQTTRQSSFASANYLNHIYTEQTNVVFNEDPTTGTNMLREKDIQISTSLYDIVMEKLRGPAYYLRSGTEWSKLASQGDPTAEINVFFMPHTSTSRIMRGFDRKVFVSDTDVAFVIPDGMSEDEVRIAFPHWVAISMGCKQTFNAMQKTT